MLDSRLAVALGLILTIVTSVGMTVFGHNIPFVAKYNATRFMDNMGFKVLHLDSIDRLCLGAKDGYYVQLRDQSGIDYDGTLCLISKGNYDMNIKPIEPSTISGFTPDSLSK